MIYAAEIHEGVVTRVLCADSVSWCSSVLGGTWVEVNTRTNVDEFVGIGHLYDSTTRTFSAPASAGDL